MSRIKPLRGATRWRRWLRHCATSWKVAGLILDGVIGIVYWHNPSGRTMALGVASASNRNEYQKCFLGVKAAGAWQLYHLHVPIVLKSGSFSLLEPSGSVQACNGIALPFTLRHILRDSAQRIDRLLSFWWINLLETVFLHNMRGDKLG